MAEFAPDHERQLVVAKHLDPVTRQNQRVRFAETKRGDGNVVVFAYEDQRHGDLQRRARTLDDRKHARVLRLMYAYARAEQAAAREGYVDHRDDDEQRDLRRTDRFVQNVSDQQGRR